MGPPVFISGEIWMKWSANWGGAFQRDGTWQNPDFLLSCHRLLEACPAPRSVTRKLSWARSRRRWVLPDHLHKRLLPPFLTAVVSVWIDLLCNILISPGLCDLEVREGARTSDFKVATVQVQRFSFTFLVLTRIETHLRLQFYLKFSIRSPTPAPFIVFKCDSWSVVSLTAKAPEDTYGQAPSSAL